MLTIKRIKKHQGFSLVEVVVATIVFLIAALGIFNVFFAMQNQAADSSDEIIAANYGRQVLESLRPNVDTRTWSTTWPLTCDSTWINWPTIPTTDDAFHSLSGTVQYKCDPEASGLRKVTLNITW